MEKYKIREVITNYCKSLDDRELLDNIPISNLANILLLFTELKLNHNLKLDIKNYEYIFVKCIKNYQKIFFGQSIFGGYSLLLILLFYNKNLLQETTYTILIERCKIVLNRYLKKNQLDLSKLELVNGSISILNAYRIIGDKKDIEEFLYPILKNINTKDKDARYPFFVTYEQCEDDEKKLFPNGFYNLGISHGLAGIISITALTSINVVKFNEIIDCFYSNNSFSIVPGKQSDEICTYSPLKMGWCYGYTGFCSMMKNYGIESKDYKLIRKAESMFENLLISEYQYLLNYEDDSVCHGNAGVVLGIKNIIPNNRNEEKKSLMAKICNSILLPEKNQRYNGEYSMLIGDLSKILTLNALLGDNGTIIEKILLLQ